MNNDYEALISRVAAACAVPRHHVAIAYGHEAPWSVCDSTIYGSGPWSIGVKYKLAWTSGFFETQGRGASLAEAESKVIALVRRAYDKGNGRPMFGGSDAELPCECGGKGWCVPCQARPVAGSDLFVGEPGPRTKAMLDAASAASGYAAQTDAQLMESAVHELRNVALVLKHGMAGDDESARLFALADAFASRSRAASADRRMRTIEGLPDRLESLARCAQSLAVANGLREIVADLRRK